MWKNKISFPVLSILLTLLVIPQLTQAPVLVQNISWEPVQAPTISGGMIHQIIIDPSNTSHLFAFQKLQDFTEVLFESRDAGANWNSVYAFPDWIYSSTIDPSNPSILYASTSISILRSNNNGRDWVKIADYGPVIASPAADTIYSIEILNYTDDCPTGNRNFVVSHDGGDTWREFPLGCHSIHQIATTSSHPNWVYIRAVSDYHSSTLFRSNDGGDSWATSPLTGEWFSQGFLPIAIDPTQPEKLYTSSGTGGIIVSTNGGLTWRCVLEADIAGPMHFAFSSGAIYAGVDPIVFGESPVIYRSLDGGETWETLPWTPPDDLNDLRIGGINNSRLFAALDGFGIFLSDDAGQTWQTSNNGLRSPVVIAKLYNAQIDPETIYAISEWPRDALFITRNGGQAWSEPIIEAPRTAVVNPDHPEVIWVLDGDGVLESVDAGQVWQRVSTLPMTSLAISPVATERPCGTLSSSEGCFLVCRSASSQGEAFQWELTLIPGLEQVGNLALSPTDENLIMVSGQRDNDFQTSIFKSQDAGQNWQEVFQGPQDYSLLNLVMSGGQPANVIAVVFQFHPDNLVIYQSLDSGESWNDITDRLAEAGGEMWTGWNYKAPVVFDGTSVPYFGTRDIVLQAAANGQLWKVVWDDRGFVEDIVIIPNPNPHLLLATDIGLWKTSLPIFRSIWIPNIFRQP
jgi:photosystem II stability/assembly factor-like uncharacterized protein